MTTWIGCYKVEITDWIDRKHFYLGISYYVPGSIVNDDARHPPALERSFLIPYSEYSKVRERLDSVTHSLMERSRTENILSEYRNGVQTVDRGRPIK